MKLCPQCQFIYEDDQNVCDMDGKELVYDPGPLALEENFPAGSPELHERAPLTASVKPSLSAGHPTGWQAKRSAVAALAAMILVVLLFAVFYAETHQARSGNKQASNETSVQSSNQPTQVIPATPDSATDLALAASEPLTPLTGSSEESSLTSENGTTSPGSLSRGGMASNAVTARGAVPEGHAPVIVLLTNGTTIKADEAWERREGVWYRQAGVVTFLKRSRVKSIQRVGSASPRLSNPAVNAEEPNRKPQPLIAQNRPRDIRSETADSKKDSRVTSFLKKTGRILKKPFKF